MPSSVPFIKPPLLGVLYNFAISTYSFSDTLIGMLGKLNISAKHHHIDLSRKDHEPVQDQRMDTLVQKKHLQSAACRRIPGLHGLYIQPYIF